MKFLLFTYDKYYPKGGWHDFRSSHASVQDAVVVVANMKEDLDFWHVVDIDTDTIVAKGNRLGLPNGGEQG